MKRYDKMEETNGREDLRERRGPAYTDTGEASNKDDNIVIKLLVEEHIGDRKEAGRIKAEGEAFKSCFLGIVLNKSLKAS